MKNQKDIILVSENDTPVGESNKDEVHKKGFLHRAFSVFILNKDGDVLLQKRASIKYHSAGLWTNACCSHPKPGEETSDAAHRRLQEEMGFDCNLEEIFSFVYRAEFENNLIENEFDHVYLGYYDGKINPETNEVEDYKWINPEMLEKNIKNNPNLYTAWLKICFDKFLKYSKNKK
jgi:isopentenyl-diphosphate Delta-isomerase